jgi:hypothetical protein
VKKANTEPNRKADYSWGSFALTQKEAQGIADDLASYLNDAPDEIILSVMVLVNSFTYTRDHSQRGYMRAAIRTAFMPFVRSAGKAMNRAEADANTRLVGEGGAR